MPVLVLGLLSTVPGQAKGLLGRQNVALGGSSTELHYSRRDVTQWDPLVYEFVDQSYSEETLFTQFNLPAGSGLDFNLGLSMQSVNSQMVWSPGLTVVGYLPGRDLKPFAAVSGGIIGTLDSFTADPIGFYGLTGGVEFPLGENTFTTLSANFHNVDGADQWGLGLELGYWFDNRFSGNLGFQYTDLETGSNWIRDPHSLGMSLAFAILTGSEKESAPKPPREPQPTDVCPR